MNNNERKLFWDTLCTLTGENMEQDRRTLESSIKKPRFLFRYRAVNINTLEALRTNRLFFSSANYYDDPFDTFLQINIAAITDEWKSYFSTEQNFINYVNNFKKTAGNDFNKYLNVPDIEKFTFEMAKKIFFPESINNWGGYFCELRHLLKKDIWSVCFSENGKNETLWLKYANQHRGFALIYDLQDESKVLCGNFDKCTNCGIFKFGTPLYPVYYSNEKYDATEFSFHLLKNEMKKDPNLSALDKVYPFPEKLNWEAEKITLIKKECHQYDEEWRLIAACSMKPPILREWIPYGIILGLQMEVNEENLVLSIAQQAGIEHIYKSYIDNNGDLNYYEVKFH